MTNPDYDIDPDLSRYEDSEMFWGVPFAPDFYKCKACGNIYWREYYFFFRCPRCQSTKIVFLGSYFLRPRPRSFVHCKAHIV